MPQDVHSKRDVFDATYAGSITRPLLPPLRSDSRTKRNPPRSLRDYQGSETEHERKARLRALWLSLPQNVTDHNPKVDTQEGHSAAYQPLTKERAQRLRDLYESELARECNGHQWLFQGAVVDWEGFLKYAESKEEELWKVFHNDLDLDGNGMLDATELQHALTSAGIELDSKTLADFMAFLTSSTHSRPISFPEFRDFLLLLPRTPSVSEIFQYYEVCKYLGDDGRGSARVNMEGDVSLSAEDRPPAKHHGRIAQGPIESGTGSEASPPISRDMEPTDGQISVSDVIGEGEEEEEEHETWLGGSMALKFLFAGGVAGAVSRTCTAPFDRLKIYLITRKVDNVGSWMIPTRSHGVTVIANAMRGIYLESGLLGFWIGNGLNVVKIFPESAIKFLSYEASKRMFARYWDHVDDSRDISGISRFMAGGIGGITSQLAIYPIETVKTQLQSTSGGQIRTMLAPTMRRMWADGGVRAYYRGLAAGLIGVFPYSAIDMSTFEALKLAYIKASGKEEPGVLALLAFGSVSGSVGATSVYPINLVRTRLQASGSSGHPQRYTGVWDVAQKTYAEEGWRGFYRGLAPTLAKVIPAVSISYVVYEHTKRRLGV
ncbi:mitochondrial carrier [Dacryopinax primogenitus]|uniref:Mitochondrial carrier n=1 Tax=Dacryopinax primogenitus (strain DJM 731) TaxID=1858805 RepID=M5GGS5_DACPD|nr:mitochondrial carrier [Dacryopinax primogenitus]EJU05998.1 mitochondrial carrier [Dacryopinax primogenitus]